MTVTCKINSGRDLPPSHFTAFRGESDQTIYHLQVGKDYPVSAIAFWESAVLFLILDETGKPNWYSAEIFSIADLHLPANWFFSTTTANEHGVRAICGYRKIATDANHYEALIERNPAALKDFYAALAEISAP